MLDVDGYFFDLDGTVFLGDKLLPEVEDTLALLRREGKTILFLTNTTTRTRRECRDRLRHMGLEVELEEVVTAAYASAVYMREEAGDPVVFVVGESALARELEEQGVTLTAEPLNCTHVLVGMDMHFNYETLHQAMKAVRGGAKLIAANPDPNCPVAGDAIPDTWSMVKAIEAASAVEPELVIGKPSAYYAGMVLGWSGLSRERCLMIGDRLETDILFGTRHGLRTALVLTGATSARDLERSDIRPDYVWASMGELRALLAPKAV